MRRKGRVGDPFDIRSTSGMLFVALFAVVNGCGCVTSPIPSVLVRPASPELARGAVSLVDALRTADALVATELASVQVEEQKRDSTVMLPLSDYRVDVSEAEGMYIFWYQHDNPDVPFLLWQGHGMILGVGIEKATGVPQMFDGM